MSYKHLTIKDCSKIEVLYHEGYTVIQIAQAIGRHRSTIYRELKRVQSASYDAQLAQDDATKHQSLKGHRSKHTPEIIQDIRTKLELAWSPEQIEDAAIKIDDHFEVIHAFSCGSVGPIFS